jgi:hypothetical protein
VTERLAVVTNAIDRRLAAMNDDKAARAEASLERR